MQTTLLLKPQIFVAHFLDLQQIFAAACWALWTSHGAVDSLGL